MPARSVGSATRPQLSAGCRGRCSLASSRSCSSASAWYPPIGWRPGPRERCSPHLHQTPSRPSSTPSDALATELDEWALHQALQLGREPVQDRTPALLLPVHYATLAGMQPRERFTQHCRLLPAHSARQLIFEVLDLPAGAPQARVRELMSYLRPFCLAIVVRLERAHTNLDHLASSGIRGLSASAATLAGEGESVAETLACLAGSARVRGMRSLLIDATAPATYRLALAAGIDHICGDGLMPPLVRLGRAFQVG